MKNTPRVRFKGFNGEWEKESFEDFFLCFIPTNTLSRAALTFEKKEVRNIHYGDILIKFGSVLDVEKESIPFIAENTDELKSHLLKNGDIIFADAAEDETVGKCTELLNILDEKVVSGLHTIACRPNKSTQNGFLGYYLNSHSYRKQLLKLMQGIKVLSISKTSLTKTSLQTPTSQKEQTKIGNFFKNIDTLIAKNQQKYEKLTQMKKALLEKMFPKAGTKEPEIRFQGFNGEWEHTEIKDITKATYGGGTPKTSEQSYWNGAIPWIQSSDIREHDILNVLPQKTVSTLGVSKSATKVIPKNSIAVVTRVGVGKLAYIKFSYATSQDFLSLSNVIIDDLFCTYAIYKKLQNELNTVQGTSIKGITKEELLSKKIIIPRMETEQSKIGELFRLLDKRIALQQEKIEKLKNMKRAFLEKMFV